ncbi:hypothetical protein CCH79_00006933 [Gambusia affinis]|uniref:Uncharacterized protein n=1 Tax=Gambusia affinis TaxID=33528 RepID=A0A315VA29_GAMAF|nr:hypothetical protein CCH79_00006933 [Gambusia affinis]
MNRFSPGILIFLRGYPPSFGRMDLEQCAASLVFSSIHGHTATTVSSVFVFTSSPTLEPPQRPSCVPLSSIPRLQTSLLIIKHQRGAKTERPTTCMSKMNAFAKLRCQKGQHLLQTDSKSDLWGWCWFDIMDNSSLDQTVETAAEDYPAQEDTSPADMLRIKQQMANQCFEMTVQLNAGMRRDIFLFY